MRRAFLVLTGLYFLILPLVHTRLTDQVFEVNKFCFSLGAVAVLSLICVFMKDRKLVFDKYQKVLLGLFGGFFISLGLSVLFSISPYQSFFGSESYHQGFVLFLAAFIFGALLLKVKLGSDDVFAIVIFPLMVGGAVQAAIAIVQYVDPEFLFSDLVIDKYANRSIGTFGQPNFLGRFLLFSLLFDFYYILRSRDKGFYGFLFVLTGLGLLATKSRAALVGAIFGMFLVMFFYLKDKGQVKIFLSCSLMALFIGVLAFGDQFKVRSDSIETRVLIYKNSPELVSNTPFLGKGLESQGESLELLRDEKLFDLVDYRTLARAHNEVLDLVLQIGILGTLFYIGFLVLTFFSANKSNPLLVPLVASFVARMFGFFSVSDVMIFFPLLFLIAFEQRVFLEIDRRFLGRIRLLFFVFLFGFTAFSTFMADKYFFEGKVEKSLKMQEFNKKYLEESVSQGLKSGNSSQVKNSLELINRHHSDWARGYYLRYKYYLHEGDYVEAEASLIRARELYPEKGW